MQKIDLFFPIALLPSGWARDVRISCDDGMIKTIAANASSDKAQVVKAIALPGLPNLHCHAFQRGMAGLAETRGPKADSFWTWRQIMYRFLDNLTPDDIEAIAAFVYLEMLEAGFTSVAEFHYLHHDENGNPYANIAEMAERIAAAAAPTGIGLTLLPSFYTHGTFGGAPPLPGQRRFINDADRFLTLLDASRRAVARAPDAAIGIAPHSLRAVSEDALTVVVKAASDGPIHIHVAEQIKEVADCLAWSGQRPVQWLLGHQDVDARWVLIHGTHMTAAETKAVAASGAVIGLCPLTEASLGDGIFPGRAYLAGGGRIGVGTDSNIEITAPGELKQLEYSQRLKHKSRNVLARRESESTGRRLYEAALAGGTQAMGRRIGALEPGRRADIVALDADAPDLACIAGDRLLDAYVFVAGKTLVKDVWVGGDHVVNDGRHHARDAITARYRTAIRRVLEA